MMMDEEVTAAIVCAADHTKLWVFEPTETLLLADYSRKKFDRTHKYSVYYYV